MADENKQAAQTGDKRRSSEQTVAAISVVLVAAIVVMLNYVAFRRYERMDVTSEGMFTLSGKTEQVLQDLKGDVDIYLFMSRGEPSFEQVDELLKRFVAKSDHVKVHYVDPEREEAEFRLLSQKFGIMAAVTETGAVVADVAAVVTKGDKRWHISRDDLVGFGMGPMPGEDAITVNVQTEQALAGALLQVSSGRATRICLTTGHGEWTVDETDERALNTFKFHLRRDNIEWQSVNTLGLDKVDPSCDALMVLGPVQPFSSSEAELVNRYLKGGGNVLIALDPILERDIIEPSGFETMLEQHGIRLESALALEADEQHLLGPNMAEFIVTDFEDHEITRRLQGMGRVFLALARPVTATGSSDAVFTLMRTTSKGFGATDLSALSAGEQPEPGPGDLKGPVGLAAAVRVPQMTDKPNADPETGVGGRLVVIGDTDFLQGPLLETPELSNLDFASAVTGYLTKREALITIAPKTIKGGTIIMSQDDLAALSFRVIVLMPLAALLLGVGVWMSRRS